MDALGCFQVKLANMTKWPIILRAGELIGQLHRAKDVLRTLKDLAPHELDKFTKCSASMATLVPALDSINKLSDTEVVQDHTSKMPDAEHLGWGPKTTDPGPDRVYPSDELKEVININPSLNSAQHEALFRVIQGNQSAFRFDGQLGHLRSQVHIKLVQGTKPISMPPYYTPAKQEAINKQIDLWLAQGIIEESKSPWGAPVIIVYHNQKPQVCIDWRKLNKATIANQHPIPKQTDILQALSGSQYLLVFDALSDFMQMEFDEES